MQGTIKLWDATTGEQIRSMTVEGKGSSFLSHLSFSPDDHFFTSVGLESGMIMWDVSTGQAIKNFGRYLQSSPSSYETSVLMPADSKEAYNIRRLIEISSGKEIGKVTVNKFSNIGKKIFSQDGRYGLIALDYEKKGRWIIETYDIHSNIRLASWEVKKEEYDFSHFSLSPDGRYVLSACIDGLKLWDSFTGRELKTYTTSETQIAGFSPDGKFIVSGFPYSPTLWDVSSGKIVQYFAGRPLPIRPYSGSSSDGKYLVVNSDNMPPFIMETSTGKIIKIFNGYKSCGAYYENLPLMLSDDNGNTVLWDLKNNKVVKKLQGIAIGYSGKHIIEVRTKRDIKFWDTRSDNEIWSYKESSGDINSFLYLKDSGQLLLVIDKKVIKFIDVASGKETMSLKIPYPDFYDLLTVLDGRYIICSTGSGVFKQTLKIWDNQTGRELLSDSWYIRPVRISPDGLSVLYARHVIDSKDPYNKEYDLKLYNISTGRTLTFSGHTDNPYDMSFSHNGKYIVSGSVDRTVKIWDAATGLLKKTFTGQSHVIRSVEITRDNKRIISTSDDGTTRLLDIATGNEIAQFLSFTDGEWITITPEGYFNASPGGAKYLNVRVGNKVYGIDQLYSKFYRPELVQLALAGKELPKGESLGDIIANNPAPEVQIISPTSGSSSDKDHATLSVKITDSGGGIGNVMIYLNGSQVANETRGVIVKGKASTSEKMMSFTIPLMEGKNEIRVIAFNKENSMESTPAFVSIASRMVTQKPNLYALVIGINEYKNKSISLNYAVPDARAFAETLKKSATPLFEKINIKVLITPAATTKEAITMAFEEVRQIVKPNDVFVFYNASHGVVDVVDSEEQYFLLTSNVLLLSSRHIGKDAIGQKELAQLIGNIPAQKKMVILDTCNAGKGGKEIQVALLQQTRGLTDSTAVKLLQRAIGSAVFSASSDTQLALEGYKGHGLFTYVLLEGLRGKADIKKDGYITVLGLADYVEENVVKLSEDVFKRQQTPTIQTGANFPIGRVR
ncbi:MAG: caspase family protein [Syntrophales bacterium]|jgi:WD40 repeat protein|nr:caspase family protein [Syntrophales bacterium]